MINNLSIGIVNTLLYPVIGAKDPMQYFEWVMKEFVNCVPPKFDKAQIVTAIDEAVSTNGWLNEIASRGDHSESDIKSFLSAIKAELSK